METLLIRGDIIQLALGLPGVDVSSKVVAVGKVEMSEPLLSGIFIARPNIEEDYPEDLVDPRRGYMHWSKIRECTDPHEKKRRREVNLRGLGGWKGKPSRQNQIEALARDLSAIKSNDDFDNWWNNRYYPLGKQDKHTPRMICCLLGQLAFALETSGCVQPEKWFVISRVRAGQLRPSVEGKSTVEVLELLNAFLGLHAPRITNPFRQFAAAQSVILGSLVWPTV